MRDFFSGWCWTATWNVTLDGGDQPLQRVQVAFPRCEVRRTLTESCGDLLQLCGDEVASGKRRPRGMKNKLCSYCGTRPKNDHARSAFQFMRDRRLSKSCVRFDGVGCPDSPAHPL